MYIKFGTFEERQNTFFNSMLTDLNPRFYKISTDRFVFTNKSLIVTGEVPVRTPPYHVSIYINGVLNVEFDAEGDGKFPPNTYITPVDNENDIIVKYE